MTERRKLTDSEIQIALAETPGWSMESGNLVRSFSFGAYLDGITFAGRVGELAETLDHHPDLLITWRKVRVSVHTHDVGGISPLDFELARQINALGAGI